MEVDFRGYEVRVFFGNSFQSDAMYAISTDNFELSMCIVTVLLQVTVENFIRVLTGRLPPSTPRSKRLLTDERSNILVYMTGLHIFLFSIISIHRILCSFFGINCFF